MTHSIRGGAVLAVLLLLAPGASAEWTADVKGRAQHDFDLLNEARMGATLALDYKLGLGSNAPCLRAHVFGGYLSVQDSVCSSILAETGLEIGKRFGDRFDTSIAYQYTYRNPVLSGAAA